MQIFKLYTSKLNPKCDSLWQKARSITLHYNEPIWFEPRVVGHDTLERFMKLSICKNIKLDGTYTNHSIRATVISMLDRAGFKGRHIIQLSSHKSESTIKEYSTKCPDNKQKEMFQSPCDAMNPSPKRACTEKPAQTQSKPPELEDVKNNLPNFNLEPLDEFNTIDDKILSELLSDFRQEEENCDPNMALAPAANVTINQPIQPIVPPAQPLFPVINAQLNTLNATRFPNLPQMYFPNSHVTINYNFKS